MFPVLVLLLLSSPAFAQAVYKCTVDGKVAYGDMPCSGGASIELAVPAAPEPDPNSGRELRLLTTLQAQRSTREAAEAVEARAHARAHRAAAARDRRCATRRLHQRWMDEDLSKAAGKRRESLSTKAHRHRQQMALECPG